MKDEESTILRLESEDLFRKDIELNINDLLYEFSTILNVNEEKKRNTYK